MSTQNYPDKINAANSLANNPATASNTKPGKKSAGKKKILSDTLKCKLQQKSTTRRKHHAAGATVSAAASRHGRNDLRPQLEPVEKPIEELQPSPTRARITTPAQLEKVITSIKQFGLVMPALIDGSNTIIAGHVICEAAKKLGLETIPCVLIEHLDKTEVEALALALNRIGETGSWNIELLGERMIALESAGIEITSTGFIKPEIDQIMLQGTSDDAEGLEEEEQDETDPCHSPKVELDDLFAMGPHRLLCGDATEAASYERLLEGHLVQCVVSDSPYNCPIANFVSGLGKHKHQDFAEAVGEKTDEEFTDFLNIWLGHCKASSSKGAIIFAFMDWRQIEKLLISGERVGLTRKNIAVWDKGSGSMGGLYRNAHEQVAIFCNGKVPATNNIELGRHGRDRTNVWSYPGANKPGTSAAKALEDHPTPKPVPLVEDALLDVTERGDIVLDPFLGSGTTLIAAENTGRICAGIELDPTYVERAIRRWERHTGGIAIHLETGMSLDELHAHRSSQGEG